MSSLLISLKERRMKPFPNLAREASCWLSVLIFKDPEEFCKHLQWLLATWKEREPKFIEYFQSAYANRAGM